MSYPHSTMVNVEHIVMAVPSQRSFLILHGIENHRPPEHWQYWLAERLRAGGHHVRYPGLPDPDNPPLVDWTSALCENLAQWGVGERVVICHSLACLLWFHASVFVAPAERPHRLLLVSPPAAERVPEAGAEFRLGALDAASVRESVIDEIRIVASDNDPYNPSGAAALYAAPLGVEIDIVAGAGHITPADGYGPWHELEAWCHDPRQRLAIARAAASRSGALISGCGTAAG